MGLRKEDVIFARLEEEFKAMGYDPETPEHRKALSVLCWQLLCHGMAEGEELAEAMEDDETASEYLQAFIETQSRGKYSKD